jgi:hypothetical protein
MKRYACLWLIAGCLLTSKLLGTDVLVEAQAGYYYPTNHKFREIYSGSGIYGLEVSVQSWRSLYAWVSGSVFAKSGHSIGLRNSTHIVFVPIGVGLKYLWKVNFVDLYLGAGVLPTYLHIHDHSPYVVQKSSKWGCGGIAKVGAIFNLPKSFFIDVFTSYSYIKISDHDTRHHTIYPSSANLSGFTFGGAIGYRFGPR